MKRYNISLEEVAEFENMLIGSKKAQKGKNEYKEVAEFNANEEANVKVLAKDVLTQKYRTGSYRTKVIFEPKRRDIYILSYPHRIVQHALINKLEPIFVKMFIKDTYACIKGRGMHRASMRCTEFMQYNKYCRVIQEWYENETDKIQKQEFKQMLKELQEKNLTLIVDMRKKARGIR